MDTVYKVGSSKTDNKAKETQQNCAPPFSQYLSPVGGGETLSHYFLGERTGDKSSPTEYNGDYGKLTAN